ncbi:acyl-CoA carboxylase epsilon subunit [Streptosporangium sp. NPDC049376]|uniref:acyl-CoA carboxylase epsilon subunit n=1 Tax=Streptosporangium sp. NPDC049376 TaxID=3366192 RepID=UPI0037B43412
MTVTATPILVVRGEAGAEELAALAVVLLALGRRGTPGATPPGEGASRPVPWSEGLDGYRPPGSWASGEHPSWAGLPRESRHP